MDMNNHKNNILLYYNPYSGSGFFKNNLDRIIERSQEQGFQIIPVRAARGVVIDEALSRIDQSKFSRIIAAGGDGTMNLCVNAMMRHDIRLPIGLLPSGTANDFAYYFDLPSEIEDLLDIALGNRTTKADVGRVNDRFFINVTALGAMVDVSQKTDPNLKNALGTMAYYLKAVTELPQIRPMNIRLITDDKIYEESIFFMVVMNGESAGGFRRLSPQSSISDGKLDVIVFRKMPIMEFGPLLIEVINGRHRDNRNVLYFQTDRLRIESDEDIATDIDGEHGEKLPLEFGVVSRRLDVFVSEEGWRYDD